jgi:hypothetical protein
MANEAVLIYELSYPIPMTCAVGTGIEKGTILKLSDPATVAASSADNDVFAGIAAEEKIANDGMTKIPVYVSGVFRMLVGAAGCTVGKEVVISAANTIVDYTTLDDEKGAVVGKALETGANGETVLVLVGIR